MSKLPYVNQSIKDEHDSASPETKRVSLYGWDADNLVKTRLTVNSDGELKTYSPGQIDEGNSTVTPINAGLAFTGTAASNLDNALIIVNIFSDVASATDGLELQIKLFGSSTWRQADVYTVPSNSLKTYSFQTGGNDYRIVYTNGGTNQSVFELETQIKHTMSKPSSHRIADSIIDDDDAELVTSVLKAKANGSGFVNIEATASNNLRVTDAESGLAIAQGNVTGTTFVHKFGDAPDFDTGDGEVTVWDGANDGLITASSMTYTYSATADIDTISSSAADTVDIEIQGLDGNLALVTQTKTLTGTTDAILDTPLKRVFRMKNVGATNLAGTVYLRTNGTGQAGGVPSTANTVRAIIGIGNNQTLMSIYTIPAGKTGYMRSFFASSAGAKKDTNYIIKVKARPSGQVFQVKHKTALVALGTTHFQHDYQEPEIFSAGTDIEITTQITEATITEADVAAGFDIVLVQD